MYVFYVVADQGPERLLAMHEKPASIVRRRLEQAGFDEADNLRLLAVEDIQYLMKFVYKSNVLGPAVRCCMRLTRDIALIFA